jgi:hypothetical protein
MFACKGIFACSDAIVGKPHSHRDRILMCAWLARDEAGRD